MPTKGERQDRILVRPVKENWHFGYCEAKKNNECEQLMRRDIPSVFVAEWLDILERVMTFIATKGRKPRERSSDTDEKYLANWIQLHKQKERGTNSEREQLMRRDIPSRAVKPFSLGMSMMASMPVSIASAVPSYVYSYFTKWSANIIEYVSQD